MFFLYVTLDKVMMLNHKMMKIQSPISRHTKNNDTVYKCTQNIAKALLKKFVDNDKLYDL